MRSKHIINLKKPKFVQSFTGNRNAVDGIQSRSEVYMGDIEMVLDDRGELAYASTSKEDWSKFEKSVNRKNRSIWWRLWNK